MMPGLFSPHILGGNPPITFVASALTRDNGSVTVNKPTGVIDGDIMLAFIGGTSTDTPTTVPSGWSLVTSLLTTVGFRIYSKVASSEGSSYFWDLSSPGNLLGAIVAYRGSPSVNIAGTPAVGDTASSITPTAPGALIGFFTNSTNYAVLTAPSGMTQRLADNAANPTFAVFDILANPAGATGSRQITWDGAGGNARSVLLQLTD